MNKAFDGDFVAEPFDISGDGMAYISKSPAELVRKNIWIRKRVVRPVFAFVCR